ncbi:MAG: hypothetical protein NT105_15535 [Verrucomicrobia bacterium]|nr:hypothetical protein [Verrucomicrobiota bacterium]
MNTRAWVLVWAVLATGLESFADGEKPSGAGANPSGQLPAAGDKGPTKADPATSPGAKDASVVDGFWEDFAYAKKVEEMARKAEKKVEELERGKEFLERGVLEKAKREAQRLRDEYDEALDGIADYEGIWLFMRPGDGNAALGGAFVRANETEKVKEAKREEKAAENAARQADQDEKELIKKADELTAAGKTKEAKEVRDRIPAATEKAEQTDKAFHKAYDDHNRALFEELKRAEAAGKLPPPSNARFKASPDPKANEPFGGLKLHGDSSYVPGAGPGGPIGLKTTLSPEVGAASQDNVGMQGTNPLQPRIFYLPVPSAGPGWGGAGGYDMPFSGGKRSDRPASAHPAGCTCKQCTGK